MLEKLFIKDYKNTDSPSVRLKYGVVSSLYGIITNVLLFAGKLIVGFLSGSIAIISDAANNLSDGISAFITLIGFKLSSKPADNDHPFGHARFEYISALIVAFIICIVGFFLGKSSVDKIISPATTNVSWLVVIVLGISVLVKFTQFLVYKKFGKAIDSDSINANAVDARNDTIVTFATLVSMIIIWVTGVNIDAYVGLAVSAGIIISGFKVLLDTISPLIGEKPDKDLVIKIKKKLSSYNDVLGFHELIIHSYGKGRNFVTVHIEVSADVDPLITHDLIDDIEEDFLKEFGLHLVIHSDPIQNKDKATIALKQKTQHLLRKLNNKLVVHDFRIAKGQNHTNIMFDLIVPYDVKLSKQEIISYLKKNLSKDGRTYKFSIDIDRNYV